MVSSPSLPSTIAEAAEWLRDGRITSTLLTGALLERAHAAQVSLGAFVAFTDEAALAAARQADAELARGVDRGPLQGIPLGVKDIIATRDAPTTANSNVLDRAWGDRDDATVVARLRTAGAVLVGKLVLHEYATGFPDPATGFPIARNPWKPTHVPAGSSSGTGVAVAAGLVLGGLGTDTSGSIRGPSAYCGISGLKPTFGRVSKEGCVPLGYSLDNIGPMARTARDCALMLQVLAGYDPKDLCSADRPVPDYASALNGSLRGVRVGVPRGYFFDAPDLDAEVRTAVLGAVEAMARAGADVREVAIPHAAEGQTATTVTIRSESYAYHERDLRERPRVYGKWTRQVLQLGALFTAADFVQAQRLRALLQAECAAALADVDVLVVPTMTSAATPFSSFNPDSRIAGASFTGIWNLVGLPALSVPCGFTAAGLPIGMQIVGRPFDEARVLAVGDAYQRVTDWHARRPPEPPGEAIPYEPPAPRPVPPRQSAVDAVVEQTRLTLVDDDRARLDAAYAPLQEQLARMRAALRSEAEPALTFRAG